MPYLKNSLDNSFQHQESLFNHWLPDAHIILDDKLVIYVKGVVQYMNNGHIHNYNSVYLEMTKLFSLLFLILNNMSQNNYTKYYIFAFADLDPFVYNENFTKINIPLYDIRYL
jgi:hypothetical protein